MGNDFDNDHAGSANQHGKSFKWTTEEFVPSHTYLWPCLRKLLSDYVGERKSFEIGCGNGDIASKINLLGWEVSGVDSSRDGIEIGNAKYPKLKLTLGSVYDDLSGKFGKFPLVYSLEVIEHLYYPRKLAKVAYDLLEPGGTFILSTPYHGYWKNLILAITGKMDKHFTVLWDDGHIKFFSPQTLTILLEEVGFKVQSVLRVGRVQFLAKSMIVIAKKS
jgi:2-polyprenyl-3-methyl-5-hydroxy-6-metoxy-1,4-benzoquinol methylase